MIEINVDLSELNDVAKRYDRIKVRPILHKYIEKSGIRITSIAKERYFGKSRWPLHEHLWVQTGRLRASIGNRSKEGIWRWKDYLTLEVGTKVVYGAIHEFGGIIRWKTKKGQAVIPRRPFLLPAIADFRSEEISIMIKQMEEEILRKLR